MFHVQPNLWTSVGSRSTNWRARALLGVTPTVNCISDFFSFLGYRLNSNSPSWAVGITFFFYLYLINIPGKCLSAGDGANHGNVCEHTGTRHVCSCECLKKNKKKKRRWFVHCAADAVSISHKNIHLKLKEDTQKKPEENCASPSESHQSM